MDSSIVCYLRGNFCPPGFIVTHFFLESKLPDENLFCVCPSAERSGGLQGEAGRQAQQDRLRRTR